MIPLTRFTDPQAVELWDNCFRWRSRNQLRDRTIDATWQRVAAAVTAPEGQHRAYWRSRYAFAFCRWQILPDSRLLRFAGTDMPVPLLCDPVAVVNAGAFVTEPQTRHARFDHVRFSAAAEVAVRLLDDAVVTFGIENESPMRLGVGLIGLADALGALGLPYDSARAPLIAQSIAQSLALGCLRASLRLVEERGNRSHNGMRNLASLWKHRALPNELADAVANDDRHECLTRIESQYELALLANGASDSLEPTKAFKEGATGAKAKNLQAVQRAIYAAVRPWIDVLPRLPLRKKKATCADG